MKIADDTLLLRRFVPPMRYSTADPGEQLRGVFVDCETTGLDPAVDEIIGLALVPFWFTRTGEILRVELAELMLEEPTRPISEQIQRLTGITPALVSGAKIDSGMVSSLVAGAALVVAHNAAFDRQFLERRFPIFEGLRFGCSMTDVPWQEEGFTSVKLEWLAFAHCGMFYEAHRADLDAYMGIHLLATALPSGKRALEYVLDAARQQWVRVWAVGAPFEKRHVLKQRGYSWSDGTDGRPKAWWIDVRAEDLAEEREWLDAAAGGCHVQADRFDARARFSDRIGRVPRRLDSRSQLPEPARGAA